MDWIRRAMLGFKFKNRNRKEPQLDTTTLLYYAEDELIVTGGQVRRRQKGEKQMWDKVRKKIFDICDLMDMALAAVVVVGIFIATVGIFPQMTELWHHRTETEAFLEFLDAVLSIVVGAEF